MLEPTQKAIPAKHQESKTKPETVIRPLLEEVAGFYTLSKMQFAKDADHSLLDDPNNLAPNLNSYCHENEHSRDAVADALGELKPGRDKESLPSQSPLAGTGSPGSIWGAPFEW